ncbi:hypothetical protein ABZ318_00825 [Streptomyces sp. NPDC006197]|uniref:hypothetical protein n=1 Tax=Streptomyces sp. NPDC006197 TaxID=3156685 RepID=UPI0033BB47D0
MSEHRKPRPDEPLPRDPEDQQAMADDPLSVPVPDGHGGGRPPDTDEAGTGPRDRPRDGTVHPGHPAPSEPAD